MIQNKQKHLRIGELSKFTGIAVSALRYYEAIDLLKPSYRENNNYRCYNFNDVAIAQFIKKAQHIGFSLEQIKTILKEREEGKSPCPKVREIAQEKIHELEIKIKELRQLKNEIKNFILENKANIDTDSNAKEICTMIDKINL